MATHTCLSLYDRSRPPGFRNIKATVRCAIAVYCQLVTFPAGYEARGGQPLYLQRYKYMPIGFAIFTAATFFFFSLRANKKVLKSVFE